MHKYGKPSCAPFVYPVHSRIVNRDSLYIGMQLYTLEPERDDLLYLRIDIIAIGMKRAKTRKASVTVLHRLGDKSVYAGNLLW